MTKGDVKIAVEQAQELFDNWNNVTGAIEPGTGWYFEMQSVIQDIVENTVRITLHKEKQKK